MINGAAGALPGLRWAMLVLVAGAIIAASVDPAEAQRRKNIRSAYNPPYAAIVVDANTGRVMHARNADAIRHPASLTKIMTLYLLFEQIDAGRLRLDSRMPVSAYAAGRPPSRLGLSAGDTITVEEAILALVTRSANDASVVIAEALGGSEANFARMMTRRARSLGMSRTTYANANGLPNPAQVTTARDQALLGRAVQERFPKLYRYFSVRRFTFRGRTIGSHNRLLGRVPGVDGIKTGFIRASGFNLVSSMRRDNRHVVAVVLGGTSGRARDARMRSLLEGHVMAASTRRTAPPVVRVATARQAPPPLPRARVDTEPAAPPAREVAAVLPPRRPETGMPMAIQPPAPPPGSAEPIRPIVVRTVSFRAPGAASQFALASEAEDAEGAEGSAPPPAAPGTLGTLTGRQIAAAGGRLPATAAAEPAPTSTASIPAARSAPRGGWVVQVGAFPAEQQAQARLKEVQSVGGRLLAGTEPFTEPVARGSSTLFRARFAGLDRNRAQAVCRHFKRNEIACLALRQ